MTPCCSCFLYLNLPTSSLRSPTKLSISIVEIGIKPAPGTFRQSVTLMRASAAMDAAHPSHRHLQTPGSEHRHKSATTPITPAAASASPPVSA
ncbi:hypothetical protein TgHK011_008706 [Trichoderma gracile]|nr:hypothetical protein TgHK011_008706 [Trichoderma gracile]